MSPCYCSGRLPLVRPFERSRASPTSLKELLLFFFECLRRKASEEPATLPSSLCQAQSDQQGHAQQGRACAWLLLSSC